MSLGDAVDIPGELKDVVSQRLKSTGALGKLTREVKVAMTAAIAEIKGIHTSSRDSDPAKSVVAREGLTSADDLEKRALHAIYNFLSAHGMTYTLKTLEQESSVPDDGSEIDLAALFFGSRQKDDAGRSD